jgi:hypothetical protein
MFHVSLVPLIQFICLKGARRLCTFQGIFKKVTPAKSEGLLYLPRTKYVYNRTLRGIYVQKAMYVYATALQVAAATVHGLATDLV